MPCTGGKNLGNFDAAQGISNGCTGWRRGQTWVGDWTITKRAGSILSQSSTKSRQPSPTIMYYTIDESGFWKFFQISRLQIRTKWGQFAKRLIYKSRQNDRLEIFFPKLGNGKTKDSLDTKIRTKFLGWGRVQSGQIWPWLSGQKTPPTWICIWPYLPLLGVLYNPTAFGRNSDRCGDRSQHKNTKANKYLLQYQYSTYIDYLYPSPTSFVFASGKFKTLVRIQSSTQGHGKSETYFATPLQSSLCLTQNPGFLGNAAHLWDRGRNQSRRTRMSRMVGEGGYHTEMVQIGREDLSMRGRMSQVDSLIFALVSLVFVFASAVATIKFRFSLRAFSKILPTTRHYGLGWTRGGHSQYALLDDQFWCFWCRQL